MSSYTLSVHNVSGATENVALYQVYQGVGGALSLCWMSKRIDNGNPEQFTWDLGWGLGWGTSPMPLSPGVRLGLSGSVVPMDPNSSGGDNAMAMTYANGEFNLIDARHDSATPKGELLVTTDNSFTVAAAMTMSVVLCMDGKPALAVQGRPNEKYLFDLQPHYYLCVTDFPEGVALSESMVTSPTKVAFEPNVESLQYELNEMLEFVRTD